MSERTLLWLLIAILVIIVVVKMCKNTNEGMRYKNNGSQLLPSFRMTMLSDNEDMIYTNNDSQLLQPVTENKCHQSNDSNLPYGNYIKTCGECSFANDNLSCYCRTMDQKCNQTSLKLDKKCDYIQNCNGNLKCGDC